MTLGKFGGGSGTASDPYLIATVEHLKALAADEANWGYYVQYKFTADIDLAGVTMQPIGTESKRFTGIVNGNGKTISNLKITVPSGDYVGLFAFPDAEISDLRLVNAVIDAPQSNYVGALAGRAARKIDRCCVESGSVSGRDQVGGLLGGAHASISQCYTACTVSGKDKVGGLVGDGGLSISQCYSTAVISGTGTVGGLVGLNRAVVADCYAISHATGGPQTGGLIGCLLEEGAIWNCYAAGKVTATMYVVPGGLCGTSGNCFNSFWDSEVAPKTSDQCGVGKTTAELRTAATFQGWGCHAAWTIDEGKDYPRLAWEKKPGTPVTTPAFPEFEGDGTAKHPYLIRTVEQLNAIGNCPGEWDKYYRLESDLDLAPLNGPFRTLGCQQILFTGTFDGGGHTIANLRCPYSSYGAGMFEWTRGATIRRVTLVNPRTEADWAISVGSLVGQQNSGTIEDCAVEGGLVAGSHYVGGLVGRCGGGTVARCYSTCTVEGRSTAEDVGGLIGQGDRCNVNNCYAIAEVSGSHWVGGLIGRTVNAGSVTLCYSAGHVTCPQDPWGIPDAGGLIGVVDRTFVQGCFWDVQTSGFATSAAGRGLQTAELYKASTFILAGWDFWGEITNGRSDFWSVEEGKDYPRLFTKPPAEQPLAWADDFEDDLPAPLWQTYEPKPNTVHLQELNGRLELVTPVPADGATALYVAGNWRLDASKDFSLKIDFRFDANTPGEGWVLVGLTPTPASPTGEYVNMTAGSLDGEAIYSGRSAAVGSRQKWWAARGCDAGTLYISYNAETDELYRSFTGFGPVNAWHRAQGLVAGMWGGKPLYVIVGGGTTGMDVRPGKAWLDNFSLDNGDVLP